jgi:CMP-N-acetylneuraminic acid synthetase
MMALIPAKGVSSRIPRKNMALLGGHPLIDWTIGPAIASGVFSEIWVSSEDEEILSHARSQGVLGLRRSAVLAEPRATVADVIEATRRTLEYRGPIYVLLPTSPFRDPVIIRMAASAYEGDPSRDLLSLVPSDHPPQWAVVQDEELVAFRALEPMGWIKPRCDLRQTYRHDGGHWIVGTPSKPGWTGLFVTAAEAVDVNTPLDLAFAEFLLSTGRVPWLTTGARA